MEIAPRYTLLTLFTLLTRYAMKTNIQQRCQRFRVFSSNFHSNSLTNLAKGNLFLFAPSLKTH